MATRVSCRRISGSCECNADTDCTSQNDEVWLLCFNDGDWEKYRSTFKGEENATEWAFKGICEAFEKLA